MFYALRVKIFCSLSELELLELKHSFPFFRKGGGGDLQCLLELVLLRYLYKVCVEGNKLNIKTSDIISDLLEYLRMLAVHSVMYSPLSGFLDPSQ